MARNYALKGWYKSDHTFFRWSTSWRTWLYLQMTFRIGKHTTLSMISTGINPGTFFVRPNLLLLGSLRLKQWTERPKKNKLRHEVLLFLTCTQKYKTYPQKYIKHTQYIQNVSPYTPYKRVYQSASVELFLFNNVCIHIVRCSCFCFFLLHSWN